MSSEAKDKCGYDHYMLKEIMEEPVVLEKTFRPYIDDITKIKDLSEYEEIHIVACGSAMYAGIIGLAILGLGLYLIVDVLEQKLCRWQKK